MIIVRLKGGLGNQMFQYALGCALSERLKVPLKLDTRWFSISKNRKFGLDNFKIPPDILIQNRALGWFDFLRNEKPFFEKNPGFNNEVFILPDNTTLDGYWQSEKYFETVTDRLQKEFTLKKNFNPEASAWANKISNCEAVSVHVRRGDYLELKHQNIIGILPTSYYQKSAEVVNSKAKDAVFFIFSDDIAWVRENLKLPSQTEFVSETNMSDSEEMMLMSLCKHNIIANSSFSWWGAWLNKNPSKTVVAPRNWFADPKLANPDLIPLSWTQI